MAALLMVQGCASEVQHEIVQTRMGLVSSVSCFRLIEINPDYVPVFVHMRRIGPSDPADKALDSQVPSEGLAALAVEVGSKRQLCEQEEATAMQPHAPQIAALLQTAAQTQGAIYARLGTRQLTWADARRDLWYFRDATATQIAPLVTALDDSNRQRLEANDITERLIGAVVIGVLAGPNAGVSFSQPFMRSFVRVR